MSVGGCCGQVSAVIARYTPRSLSPAAAVFAREIVAQAAPETEARAKALLFAASRLAVFAEAAGLEPGRGLLCEAVIERLVLCGCDRLAPASVRTLRTNLRALARALEAFPQPTPTPLSRERAKAPYSPAVRRTGFGGDVVSRFLGGWWWSTLSRHRDQPGSFRQLTGWARS